MTPMPPIDMVLQIAVYRRWARAVRLLSAALLFALYAHSIAHGNPVPPVIELSDTHAEYEAAGNMLYREDPTKMLTIDDVTKPGSPWKESPRHTPNFGFSTSAYWFAFRVKNTRPERKWVFSIRYPLFDDVRLYAPRDGTLDLIYHTGDMLPFHNRPILDNTFTVPLHFDDRNEITFFVRISTESAFNCIFSVMEEGRFHDIRAREKLVYGLYFGILLVISLYNLLIFIKVRDKNYIFYIMFVITHGLFQMSFHGLSMEYLWPHSPIWNNIALNFFGGQSIIWTVLFAKYFLETGRTAPRLDKALLFFIIPGGVQMLTSFFLPYSIPARIGTMTLIPFPVLLWLSGFIAYRSGFRQARFYLLAWSVYLAFVVVWALSRFALLPTSIISEYGMQIGSAIEAVLLSLALGDRMNILGEEKILAQRNLIEEQNQSLALQKQYTESISRFVPSEFLSFLHRDSIIHVELGDQTIERMCVLFSDIRSFTAISERLSPRENIDFINAYLSRVGPVIREHHGFIDKYIGDAIMALFPGSPDNALRAALCMKEQVRILSREHILPLPVELRSGIGIHYGPLMLGTVGEEHRIDTTVISDAVNVASRLEGLTKKLPADIIISQEVRDALENPAGFRIETIGRVKVKGRERPLLIYSVQDLA